jgi:catechol 2,3-dioxygenase
MHAELIIGEVHLTVANSERSLAFYCNLIGLRVARKFDHRIVLVPDARDRIRINPPRRFPALAAPRGHGGFYHFAFHYPRRREFARIVKRLIDAAYGIDDASDYGVAEAVYLRDPDGIPVELYVERPEREWPRSESGDIRMICIPLDLEKLLCTLR